MLLGELDIDGTPALASLHKVSEGIEKFEHNIKGLAGEFAGFFLVFETISKVVESFEGVLAMGAHMEALHVATGESVHDLVVFGHALDITGGSAESAQNFIFKLQNAIAGVNEDGKNTAESLHLLGTSAEQLRSAPLLEQVDILQKGLAKIPDQATKVAAIKDLFGFRFAAQAMPLLANPEALDHAKQQAEPLANVLDRNAEKFHELEVALKDVGIGIKSFFAGALEGLAPTAGGLANAIASIDFVDLGRTTGVVLNIFLQLARVFEKIVPLINGIAQALANMNTGMLKGAVAGAALGLAAGPLGAIVGAAAGGFIGNSFFGDSGKEKHGGWADSFKGLSDATSGKDTRVGALQRVGRGGGFGGGDPMLSETQRIGSTLLRIEQKIGSGTTPSGIPGIEFPAV